ncbi:hypothetical protein LY76DRAFT_599669 [Colletotrichum caudatum]|nr:hypothetical protein LY76DRAFT_599669 [Colletotrichum caudatum]
MKFVISFLLLLYSSSFSFFLGRAFVPRRLFFTFLTLSHPLSPPLSSSSSSFPKCRTRV